MKVVNIIGKTFNHLTGLRFDHRGRHGLSFYLFKCNCGNTKILCGTDVTQGKTKSCGCHRREYMSVSRKLPDGVAALNNLFLFYKSGAKIRGLDFTLDKVTFERLTKSHCVYCGVEPLQKWQGARKHGVFSISSPCIYNGIDRVDNNKGYIEGNVVPCCKVCNQAKHAFSIEDFTSWINRLVAFQNSEGGAIRAGRN